MFIRGWDAATTKLQQGNTEWDRNQRTYDCGKLIWILTYILIWCIIQWIINTTQWTITEITEDNNVQESILYRVHTARSCTQHTPAPWQGHHTICDGATGHANILCEAWQLNTNMKHKHSRAHTHQYQKHWTYTSVECKCEAQTFTRSHTPAPEAWR